MLLLHPGVVVPSGLVHKSAYLHPFNQPRCHVLSTISVPAVVSAAPSTFSAATSPTVVSPASAAGMPTASLAAQCAPPSAHRSAEAAAAQLAAAASAIPTVALCASALPAAAAVAVAASSAVAAAQLRRGAVC